jgi:putative hydrolase of the HAD superfamily
MPIQAVFFDVGNTLIYADPPVGEAYAGVLKEAGIDAPAEEVERSFRRAFRRMRAEEPQSGQSERDAMDWWRRVVRESFEPFGRPEAFEAVFRRLWGYFALPGAWRVYGDVLPALDALEGRGVGIGLISNWDSRLRPVLADMGLLKRVRWPVISCEVGAEKPQPAIFRHALGRCGLAAGQVMHVGDSLEADALGALRSGLRSVWLCREGDGGSTPKGVRVVRSLSEVPALLDAPAGPIG